MRIALVIERFEPRRGGVEAVAWTVAHALAATGDDITVFARRAVRPEPHAPALRVERLRVPSAWQPLRVLAFSAASARAWKSRRFDVVQSFSRTRHQDVYRAGGGCHAVYMERTYGPRAAYLRRWTPRHATLLALEARVFADPRQWLVCNSEMVRREIAERYHVAEERFAVIPNGVDLDRFRPDAAAESARSLRRELAPEAARVWLLAGSGFRRKGVDTALRALARAADPDAVLWIAGRDPVGPWRALAERLGVATRTRFLGPRDDLPAVYAAADALLLPTRYDAFANVCLEAAAAGLPIVTSAANGAAAWLGDEAALVVDDPEDVEGIAGALHRLRDPELRRSLGAAALSRARTASWDAHVAALRALYRRVAA